MTLAEYLEKNSLTLTEFGARIGVSHAAISRYRNGQRRPEWNVLERIQEETGGAVRPEDFYGGQPADGTEAA